MQKDKSAASFDPQFIRMYAAFQLMTREERDHQETVFVDVTEGRKIKSSPDLKLIISS